MTAPDQVGATPDAGAPVEEVERVIRTTDGVVCCEVCDWAAAMTGDNWAEIEAFLRARLREHTHYWHAADGAALMIATHYVLWDAPGGRLVRALCGILIRRREHANAPTCPTCAKLLAEREAAPGPA